MKTKKISQPLILLLILIGLIALMTPFAEYILSYIIDNWIPFAIALVGLIVLAVLFRHKQTGKLARSILVLGVGSLAGSVAMIFLLGSLGINFSYQVRDQLTPEQAKSSYGIVNSGTIAETADYVFYIEPQKAEGARPSGAYPLIRRSKDWTGRTVLKDSAVSYIFADENWIYYVDQLESSHLFRMDHAGGQLTQVTDDRVERFTVSAETVFYSTADAMYRIQADGSGKTELKAEGSWPRVLGKEDWLYYSPGEHSLWRMKSDGSQAEEVLGYMDDHYLAEDAIYYMKLAPGGKYDLMELSLYKRGYEDAEPVKLTVINEVLYASFNEGYLYLQKATPEGRIDAGMYRADLDGSDPVKFNKLQIWQYNDIVGDWIYILQYSGKQYRIKLDGSIAVPFE